MLFADARVAWLSYFERQHCSLVSAPVGQRVSRRGRSRHEQLQSRVHSVAMRGARAKQHGASDFVLVVFAWRRWRERNRMLLTNRSIRELDVWGTKCTAAAALEFARVIAHPDCILNTLVLNGNELGAEAGFAIANALLSNRTLRVLRLWSTQRPQRLRSHSPTCYR